MKLILPECGLGDALALTATIREAHVADPGERIEIAPSPYMEVFAGNPHVSQWGGDLGRVVYLETERHGNVGNIAVSFGIQMGVRVLDTTPEIFGVPDVGSLDLPNPSTSRGSALIAVDPHARALSRRWVYERWLEVVASLRRSGYSVVAVGRRVAGQCGEVADPRALPVDVDLTDKLTLHETAAVLRECDLFLGVDSGGAHLAAAVGTPQVVLYSRSPWYSRAYWNTTPVYAPSTCPALCNRECDSPVGRCLDTIHAGEVVRAVSLALSRFGGIPRGNQAQEVEAQPASGSVHSAPGSWSLAHFPAARDGESRASEEA